MTHPSIRQHPRFPARLPLLFDSPAVPGPGGGVTLNVSQGGLLLGVPQPLPPGTPASLLLFTGDCVARAEVVVVWMVEDIPCRLGVRFTWLTGNDHLAWEQLLAYQADPRPRASARIPVALEVTCLLSPDGRVPGQIQNLSDDGLMVSLAQELAPRTRLAVSVPPWHSLPPVEVRAEVVWTRATSDGPGVLHGLRFLSDDRERAFFVAGALLRQLLDPQEASSDRSVYLLALLARTSAGRLPR